MDVWVQATLFDVERVKQRRDQAGSGRISAKSRHANWSRVTRDPAVATSYGESIKVAVDFRLGLARALGQLSPEQRQALRETVDRPIKREAA